MNGLPVKDQYVEPAPAEAARQAAPRTSASDDDVAAFFDEASARRGLMTVAIEDIEPNPYRTERLVLREGKIAALLQSYNNSGFWAGSLQARPHPSTAGKYQLAFGHHRLEAARRANLTTLGLMVEERSNAEMLRMLADENRAEFRHDPVATAETIRSVVEAFARGEIELPSVSPDTRKDLIYVAPGGATYTASTLARFLGWTKGHGKREPQPTTHFRRAFGAYQKRFSSEAVIDPLDAESSKDVPSGIVRGSAKGTRAKALQKGAQTEVRGAEHPVTPMLEVVTEGDTRRLTHQLEYHDLSGGVWDQCRRLAPHLSSQNPELIRKVADALERLGERFAARTRNLAAALRASDFKQFAKILEDDPTEDAPGAAPQADRA